MDAHGIEYGALASGYAPSIMANVQVASIQSVARWWQDKQIDLPPARLVIVDEIHNEKGDRMQNVLDEHERRGAVIVVVTATPIGIGHLARQLVIAGTTSELRDCGALVPADTFAPDEPSIRAFKPQTAGILQFKDEYKDAMQRTLIGRVLEHFPKHNPAGNPSILFAPGVPESLMFAHRFFDAGYTAAHIDAKRIWINGEAMPATRENRELLHELSRTGKVQVICNRFVMREGVNYPWLAHGILACTFGSLCSYLQACGRLLRAHPSLNHVTIADHGGNYWRYSSVNDDRQWSLDEDERHHATRRSELFRTKAAIEPTPCPKCGKIRIGTGKCPNCGHFWQGKQRTVIETDGRLRLVRGDIFRKRVYSERPELEKAWVRCVFRCRNSGRTFAQARGLFLKENYPYSPAPHYQYIPKSEAEWCLKIKDVLR
jgi:superfamily II DNA or RNA helicase